MGLRPANWETSTEFNQRWESSSKFLRWRWNMFENTNYQTTHWCETYHSPIVDNHKGGIFVFCWVWLPRGGKNLKHWIFYIPSLCKKKTEQTPWNFTWGRFTLISPWILRVSWGFFNPKRHHKFPLQKSCWWNLGPQPQHLLGWENNPQFLWVGPESLKLTKKIGGTLPTLLWKGS